MIAPPTLLVAQKCKKGLLLNGLRRIRVSPRSAIASGRERCRKRAILVLDDRIAEQRRRLPLDHPRLPGKRTVARLELADASERVAVHRSARPLPAQRLRASASSTSRATAGCVARSSTHSPLASSASASIVAMPAWPVLTRPSCHKSVAISIENNLYGYLVASLESGSKVAR